MRKMLKSSSSSTSSVCLDLDLCNPASSQQTATEHPLWKGQLLPMVHLTYAEIALQTAESNWGKDFPLAKSLTENTSILK